MTLRYQSGTVSVALGGLEEVVRRALEAAESAPVKVLRGELDKIAANARAEWYGSRGVERETGLGGDIEVITTLTDTEIRLSIGSTDDRRAGGKPLPVFIHRPGPLSLVEVEATREEWWAEKKAGKKVGPFPKIYVLNPKAGDGKYLLEELIKKPTRAAARKAIREIRKEIAEGVKRGR